MAKIKVISSSKELTPREKLLLSDRSDALNLNDICEKDGQAIFNVADFVELEIDPQDGKTEAFTAYLFIDVDGNKYTTSSPSFWQTFNEIREVMEDSDEDYSVKAHLKQGRNSIRPYLVCSIV